MNNVNCHHMWARPNAPVLNNWKSNLYLLLQLINLQLYLLYS